MSATEGLIDIRDVTIVIGLSQTLSNPLSSVQYDSCQLFRIQPLGRRPSSPWHTSYLIKNPASDLKKKKGIIYTFKNEASVLPAVID